MSSKVEIKSEGDIEKIFKDGKFDGEVIRLENGQFQWRNLLAHRIDTPLTKGICASRHDAFVHLGYVIKEEQPERPKKGKK